MSRKKKTSPMERFPSFPESATHSINSIKKVALRNRPSYFKTSPVGNKDEKLKGDIVDVLSNGTKLIVLDEGAGYACAWVHVLVVGKDYGNTKLYVHRENIRKLTGTADTAPTAFSPASVVGGNRRVPPIIDWTSLEPNKSHFDPYDAKYKVCVELKQYQSAGADDIDNRLKIGCTEGLKIILRDNGKPHDDETVANYISKVENKEIFQFCAAEEYFVDLRPNTYLKVLVTLPMRYLSAIANDKNIIEVDGIIATTRWDVLEDVVFKASYNTLNFKQDIKKTSALLTEYGKQISRFKGTVTDYDATFEAENIEAIVPPLQQLMDDNGLTSSPFEMNETLELGWDSTLTLIYVSLLRESGNTVVFSKGVEQLSDSVPFDSQRTQGYLWNLNEIKNITPDTLPWTDFLFAYTLPEPPKVNPSKKKGSRNFHENIGTVESSKEKLSKKMSTAYNDSPIKTYRDKISEDIDVGDLETKFNLYRDRVDSYDFVGDFTASCEGIQKTINSISTVDDAFEAVLDKVNIADLISQCMGQITSDLSNVQDLDESIRSAVQSSPGDFGSGVGLNDIADVEIGYDELKSSIPSDVNFDLESLTSLNIDTLGVGKHSFNELGLTELTVDSLGMCDIKIKDISGISTKDYIEVDPVDGAVVIVKTGQRITEGVGIDAQEILNNGGPENYSMNQLGLCSTTVSDIGFNELNMEQLGLSGLTFDSLGLSSHSVGELSLKIKELGISGATEVLDNLGADKIPGLSSISDKAKSLGIDDSLTKDLDMAQDKLDKLKDFPSTPQLNTDAFSQTKPKMPPSLAMNFPDSLPTQDIMASMGDAIEGALTSLLNEIFVAMVKNVLQNLTDSCNDATGEGEQFGKSNLNEMLEDSIPDGSPGQAGPAEALAALMDTAGFEDFNAPDAASKRAEVVSMLDDVSLLLTPVELCTLINGTATRKTLTMVRSLLTTGYPNINITRKSQVVRFFKSFGSMIDPSICRILESPTPAAPNYIVGDTLCNPAASETDELRSNLLRDRGDMTPEQVSDQLNRARDRKANAAKVLADFVNKGPLSDDFAPPPVFCQKGSEEPSSTSPDVNSARSSQKQKGLVDLSHDSIDYMTEKAVDLMFEPVYMAFSSDILAYPSAFIKAPEEEKSITLPADTDNNRPEMKIDIQGTPKIMPSLKSTLSGVETNPNILFGDIEPIPATLDTTTDYNQGATGIEIPLPTDAIDLSFIKNLGGVDIEEAIEEIESSSVSWRFGYIEPKVAPDFDISTTPLPYDIYLNEQSKAARDDKIVFNYSTSDLYGETLANTLSQEKYNFLSSPDAVNLRRHKFASLLTNNVSSFADSFVLEDSEFYEMAKGYYDKINQDVLAYISDLVTKSPFFKSITVAAPAISDEGDADLPETVKPVLTYLNLDPEPTLEQKLEGCDPHLLDLKNKKAELKENMKSERCIDLSAPTDGSPADSMSDQEKEMIKLCVSTIVRSYMIDFYMRGIFSNSIFAGDSTPDELYLSSVVNFILQDLDDYDRPNMVDVDGKMTPVGSYGTYRDDFLEALIEVSDMSEQESQVDSGDISSPLTTDSLGDDALRSLIKEQYTSVYSQMRERINSLMVSDIESRFVLEYLPILKYDGNYYESTRMTPLFTSDPPTTNKFANGNLYLEPYYYIEHHGDPSDSASFNYQEDNPSTFSTVGVVNRTELDTIIDRMKMVDNDPDKKLVDFKEPSNGFFKSISRGLRLMYRPPADRTITNEGRKITYSQGRPPSINQQWKSMWDDFTPLIGNPNFKQVAIEKCFVQFEVVSMSTSNTGAEHTLEYDAKMTYPVMDGREIISEFELNQLVNGAQEREIETRYHLLSNHEDFRAFVDFMFPIKRYKTLMEIFCQQATSYDTAVSGAMSATKDELRRLFFAINSRGDYKQSDPSMDEVGGPAGLDKMMKNEFGLLDMPASPNSWNYNLPVGWGKSAKGLGFESVAKATGEAVLKIFKNHVEKTDPNISIAKKLSFASKMANVNIPTTAWSFMLMPANVIPGALGPPIGPTGFAYHGLGLGMWGRAEGASGENAEDENTQLEAAGFKSTASCKPEFDYDTMYKAVTQIKPPAAVIASGLRFSIVTEEE